jgi:transcriptional regulator with XRE-family HTH domain
MSKLRIKQGVRIRDVAAAAGVSKTTVSLIVNGRADQVSPYSRRPKPNPCRNRFLNRRQSQYQFLPRNQNPPQFRIPHHFRNQRPLLSLSRCPWTQQNQPLRNPSHSRHRRIPTPYLPLLRRKAERLKRLSQRTPRTPYQPMLNSLSKRYVMPS